MKRRLLNTVDKLHPATATATAGAFTAACGIAIAIALPTIGTHPDPAAGSAQHITPPPNVPPTPVGTYTRTMRGPAHWRSTLMFDNRQPLLLRVAWHGIPLPRHADGTYRLKHGRLIVKAGWCDPIRGWNRAFLCVAASSRTRERFTVHYGQP